MNYSLLFGSIAYFLFTVFLIGSGAAGFIVWLVISVVLVGWYSLRHPEQERTR